jgi:plastocyanin
MRFWTIPVFFVFLISLEAHEVGGTVEVLLKGDKKKSDLSSVIVYLDQIQGDARITPAMLKNKFEMSTKNKQFFPRFLPIPLGAKVDFPNYDPIYHNLFSVSRPNDFDLGLYKGGASKSKTFESPGIVRVFCNVHPQMSATIVVCNTPYYGHADKSGKFSLGLIPWGIFELRAHSEEGQASQKIEVKDIPLNIKLTIDGRSFKKLPHKNKFGKDYSTDEERY